MNENNSKKKEPVDEWQMKMAERIVAERKIKGWTQEKLAEEVGRDTGTVASWEQGRVVPPFKCMVKLADLFDCDLDYLTGRIDVKAHNIETMCEISGLTPKAAETIVKFNGPRSLIKRSISHFIETRQFINLMLTYEVFLELCEKYMNAEMSINEFPRLDMQEDKVEMPPEDAMYYYMNKASMIMQELCKEGMERIRKSRGGKNNGQH